MEHFTLEDGTKLKLSLKAVSVDPEIGFYTGNLLYSRHTNILFEYDYTQ